ncbi:MAG: hypothetical protein AAB395_00610 [Patescibacteria group bacterium]
MKKLNIKARLQQVLVANFAIVMLAVAGLVGISPTASAALTTGSSCTTGQVTLENGTKCAQPTGVADNLTGQGGIFATVANILLFLVGAVAVIMLIIGGLRYVTSNGDQNAVTGAKNTIMYAIIGIVVAFLAYAGVQFVTTQLTAGSAS